MKKRQLLQQNIKSRSHFVALRQSPSVSSAQLARRLMQCMRASLTYFFFGFLFNSKDGVSNEAQKVEKRQKLKCLISTAPSRTQYYVWVGLKHVTPRVEWIMVSYGKVSVYWTIIIRHEPGYCANGVQFVFTILSNVTTTMHQIEKNAVRSLWISYCSIAC